MQKKQKKLMLSIIGGIALIGIALAVALPLTLCKKNKTGQHDPFTISDPTITPTHNFMYMEDEDYQVELPNSINLKTLSLENGGTDTFFIDGEIHNTIFIPSDFSCWLYGSDDSKIVVNNTCLIADGLGLIGIVIGSDVPYYNGNGSSNVHISNINVSTNSNTYSTYGIYCFSTIHGIMEIENSSFSSLSTEKSSYGINFYYAVLGVLKIKNNNISSFSDQQNASGIAFDHYAFGGHATISDNTISVAAPYRTYDIYFKEDILYDSQMNIINNILSSEASSEGESTCIYNPKTIVGKMKIDSNIIYCFSSQGETNGLYFSRVSGSLDIENNIIDCQSAWDQTFTIIFKETISGVVSIINNSIFTDSGSGEAGYCIKFGNIDVGSSVTVSENVMSISSSPYNGIYFTTETDLPQGQDNVLFFPTGSSGNPVYNYTDHSVVFFSNGSGTGEPTSSFLSAVAQWTDENSKTFKVKATYAGNITPDQKSVLKQRLESYSFINATSKKIVDDLIGFLV